MPAVRFDETLFSEEKLSELIASYAIKFAWFAHCGYKPHYFQALFHTASKGDSIDMGLCRFRHLVAGRRGGKTLSAAWEVLFYVLHPEEFHWDYHRKKAERPLTVWVVTKDFPTGHAALVAFREAIRLAGLEYGVDYKEHKGNHWFEFPNGSFVHFRSAEDPQSLRGAGLDILWMDEAAFIPNRDAWDVVRPALSDKIGMVITTTTPDGKNWLWEMFFQGAVLLDGQHFRVEYRSIDNPYFSTEEWAYLANPENYHPLLFRREYMAAFDAMAGKELPGDWLKFWVRERPDPRTSDIVPPRHKDRPDEFDLRVYIGIDPAISLSDDADRFVICAIGVTQQGTQAFLLDMWAGKIPFPDQIDLLKEWHLKWRPQVIGVEAVAYQRAFEQQASRLEGMPMIVPMFAKGKKHERILTMAPLFKIGKVRIHREHGDFINEWVDYDSTKRNPKDDCLDAMEIALRTAGILLPSTVHESNLAAGFGTMDELAWSRQPKGPVSAEDFWGVDEHLGGEW